MNLGRTPEIAQLIELALWEDVRNGDVTTLATIPESATLRAAFVAREPLVAAGLDLISMVYQKLDPGLRISILTSDGSAAEKGTVMATVEGSARAALTGERVALNFVQRLSGIATLTRRYVNAVAHTAVKVLDTRKTTPGWRGLEKHAVACGGGTNHRHGLFDMVLIKDNHLAALREALPNAIAAAVKRSRERFPNLKIEVEADTLDQAAQAADAGADIILLDNMKPDQLREAVRIIAGRSKTEASGGVNLETIGAIAESGVDFVSVGALTHSARAVDIGLDYSKE